MLRRRSAASSLCCDLHNHHHQRWCSASVPAVLVSKTLPSPRAMNLRRLFSSSFGILPRLRNTVPPTDRPSVYTTTRSLGHTISKAIYSTSNLADRIRQLAAATSINQTPLPHLDGRRCYHYQPSTPPPTPPPSSFPNEVVNLATLPDRSPIKLSACPGIEGIGSAGDNIVEWLKPPKTVLLIKKPQSDEATKSGAEIASLLAKEYGIRTLIEPEAANDLPYLPVYDSAQKQHLSKVIDFVITVGGDGTILHVSTLFQKEAPPILSFSKGGTLGFLVPYTINEHRQAIKDTYQGGFSVTTRMRLQSKVHHTDPLSGLPTQTNLATVMNEVVFQGDAARITLVDCYINDEFLSTIAGDGLIAATSTGSTAYSLSCGGSMVHPNLHSVILTPISPRSLFFRPLVLPSKVVIKFQLTNHDSHGRENAQVWLDGRAGGLVSKRSVVEVSESPHSIMTVNKCDSVSDWSRSVRAMIRYLGDLTKRSDMD